MHKPHYFTIGFLFVLFVIFEFSIIGYMYVQNKGFSEKMLNFVWSSMIFLFVMIGIIVVSLFINSHLDRKEAKKRKKEDEM